ncbi:MAG: hypothetical protein ACE5J3_07075 [Methanosarcinales archaeon]
MKIIRKIIIIFFIFLFLTTLSNAGILKKYEEKPYLNIKDVDISAEAISEDDVILTITTYIDNRGGDSGNTKILVKAYNERTKLLVASSELGLGIIKKGKTINGTLSLTVPKSGDYRIEVILYEDEGEVLRGKSYIRGLATLPTSPKHSSIKIRDIDVRPLSVKGNYTTFQVFIYIDNTGKVDSDDLIAIIKMRDADSNLLWDTGRLDAGIVKKDKTSIKSINLTVPKDKNYVVDVMIFENDKIIAQEGTSLYSTTGKTYPEQVTKKTRTVSKTTTESTEFIVSTPTPSRKIYKSEGVIPSPTPGFEVIIAIAMLLIIFVIRKRIKR